MRSHKHFCNFVYKPASKKCCSHLDTGREWLQNQLRYGTTMTLRRSEASLGRFDVGCFSGANRSGVDRSVKVPFPSQFHQPLLFECSSLVATIRLWAIRRRCFEHFGSFPWPSVRFVRFIGSGEYTARNGTSSSSTLRQRKKTDESRRWV